MWSESAAVCQLAKCVGTSEVGAARRNVQWAVVLYKPSPAPPRQTFWEEELAGKLGENPKEGTVIVARITAQVAGDLCRFCSNALKTPGKRPVQC